MFFLVFSSASNLTLRPEILLLWENHFADVSKGVVTEGNLIRMSSRDLFLTDFASREAQYFHVLLFCYCFFARRPSLPPFEICFLESDDNWSVWLMCEFCLAPRPRTSTPISSVHQKALSKSSPGSRDRRLTGLNMICAMRKWAMTWEVEWESINVECDVRAGCWEIWSRDRRKWTCASVKLFLF